jgi:hypothetical protein
MFEQVAQRHAAIACEAYVASSSIHRILDSLAVSPSRAVPPWGRYPFLHRRCHHPGHAAVDARPRRRGEKKRGRDGRHNSNDDPQHNGGRHPSSDNCRGLISEPRHARLGGSGADIEPPNTHAKELTARASEVAFEYPAQANVGGAARCRVGFPVSGPGGRVDVSVSGHGEGANLQRG